MTHAQRPSAQAPAAVSVIIPTYNRLELLKASLASVAAQTFRAYEIIVVDDGSTDGTAEYLAAHWPEVRCLRQENQGAAEARNHGLREVHTEFVAFLDSDDRWEPDFLAATVGELRRSPDKALVYTNFVSTDENGRVLGGHRKRHYEGDVTARLFGSTFIHTSAVVARAHTIRDAGGFDGRLTHNEDYDLWLRLSLRHRFGLIDRPLCLRRCTRDGLSRNGCGPDTLLRKAVLLEDFYDHRGGKPKIEPATARHRLARVYYTAGKAFLRAGRPADARAALRRSMAFIPARPRTWFWYLCARLCPNPGGNPDVRPAPAAGTPGAAGGNGNRQGLSPL